MRTSTIDYFVTAHGVIERGMFYNYMHELGYKDDKRCTREEMINIKYPFGVCMSKKELLIVESATHCYLMQKAGKLKTVEQFKEIIENN